MNFQKSLFFLFCLFLSVKSFSQNLPSLLTDKNINATFSILAYDEEAQEWGIAVATNNICVGNSTIYIEPGLGAFSVIAETEPKYAIQGFQKLTEGKSIKDAILEIKEGDPQAQYRQVSGIDSKGTVYAFTGSSLQYWNGTSKHVLGPNYVVMGNQLHQNVLAEMAKAFELSEGTLAQRLLKSLTAGQNAGGQIQGKQSAAVVVKGTRNEWYNQIDLRVDNSKNPIQELQVLMNYHYGRITLNQAGFAHRKGNTKRALEKLEKAEMLLEGWNGMYARIAKTHLSMGNPNAAVKWIKKGLAENTQWSVYLPSFYILKDHPEMKDLIDLNSFSLKNWEHALSMFSNLGKELELIQLAEKLIHQKKESSQLYYLLGRACYFEKQPKKAILYLRRSIDLDKANLDAQKLYSKLREKNK